MSHSEGPEWAIIYSGLTVLTSEVVTWADAPETGLLAIVFQSPETGWSIAQPGDYYVKLEGNEFIALGYDSVVDYMCNVFRVAMVQRIGAPTLFILRKSGQLLDKDGLILFALKEGLMKRGRMVTRTEWAQATGLALEIMGNVKKTGRFEWEEVLDGLS